nr:leucine rich repeat containing protein 51 [Hymenolepis microstoma]
MKYQSNVQIGAENYGLNLPLDFSFCKIKTSREILRFSPRINNPLYLKVPKNKEHKWLTKILKLNNNELEDLNDLPEVLKTFFPTDNWLTWLDLSCNQLTQVHPELTEMKKLKILYLHGNKIASIRELLKLETLQNLTKLTAHGNPAELEPGYFSILLAALPNLVKLDFTGISINERLAAARFRASLMTLKAN